MSRRIRQPDGSYITALDKKEYMTRAAIAFLQKTGRKSSTDERKLLAKLRSKGVKWPEAVDRLVTALEELAQARKDYHLTAMTATSEHEVQPQSHGLEHAVDDAMTILANNPDVKEVSIEPYP